MDHIRHFLYSEPEPQIGINENFLFSGPQVDTEESETDSLGVDLQVMKR